MYKLALLLTAISCIVCEDQLLSVLVIFRHGERVIDDSYPTDPYRNISYWPKNFGQLITKGKERHYHLGQWFRKRYDGFLPTRYSDSDIYVVSTDMDRALDSAASNLAGLYTPEAEDLFDKDIKWQPIPIHTTPYEDDYLLGMGKPCQKHNHVQRNLLKSEDFTKLDEKNKQLYQFLSNATGLDIKTFKNVKKLHDTLTIEQEFNFTLPEWTKDVFPNLTKPLFDLSYLIPTYTTEMQRLYVGPLFSQIVDHFDRFAGKNLALDFDFWARKFIMLSGHHNTLITTLNSMGVLNQTETPEYAATIIMEMKTDGTKTYMNLFFKNGDDLGQLVLPGCEFNCPYDDFVKILKPITVSYHHWKHECKHGSGASGLEIWAPMVAIFAALVNKILC